MIWQALIMLVAFVVIVWASHALATALACGTIRAATRCNAAIRGGKH